ncbi:MAG: hypothetical protein IJA27_08510 [Lachnospiraceae bacterium]|nr:hypothetical protein [Lachnospiraceae bacterium]
MDGDGILSDKEVTLLGKYENQFNRIAVTGNFYQFLPLLPQSRLSRLYYSIVKRDAVYADMTNADNWLTIEGRIYLDSGLVLKNSSANGVYKDELSKPVQGAQVVIDGQTVTTDSDGVFTFKSPYYRSGENYQAVISYDGVTYSEIMQVGAFKNIHLKEYQQFTPYNFNGYLGSDGNYTKMDFSSALYPNNADKNQRYEFSLSENIPNLTADEVYLHLYSGDGRLLNSYQAEYNKSTRKWSAEFNPANYTGVTSGTALVAPAGSYLTISAKGSNGITYPEYKVGVVYKQALSTINVLNSFKSPVNDAIDYIGTLDTQFDLGLTVKADDWLGKNTTSDGDSVLISMGISKAFNGDFKTGGKSEDSKKDDSSKSAESNALDYLKSLASDIRTADGTSDAEVAKKALDAAKGAVDEAEASKKDSSVLEGYQLDMGVAFYLSLKVNTDENDKNYGKYYFDGLVVCATMLADVGYKYEMTTPIGITLHTSIEFSANVTGIVVVEPYNYSEVYFDGNGEIDLTKAGDSDPNRELDVYGKLIVCPTVSIGAGASVGVSKLSASATVTGKAEFDMSFSTSGNGTGNVRVTAKLVLDILGGTLKKEWTLVDKTWNMFEYATAANYMLWNEDYRYETITSDDTMVREYINNQSEWNGSGISLLRMSQGWTNEQMLQSGMYPYAYPLITEIRNPDSDDWIDTQDQLMVFMNTDKEDECLQNSTRLYYTICENGTWSEPIELDTDETNDDTPSMFDLGDSVLVVWSSATSKITEDMNPVDIMNNRDIKARFFDKATRTWGEISNVTTTTEQDTTGDDTPSITYCETEDGEQYLMVTYVKSAYQSSGENDEVLVGDLLEPVSTLAYRFYDFEAGKWVDTYDADTMAGLTNALNSENAVDEFEENWYGQGFVDLSSYVTNSNARNSVGYDPEITENEGIGFVDSNGHAIGLNAYVTDTDGDMSTLYDREIFLQFYDFTDEQFYTAIRLTNDDVEQSYISPLTTLEGAELFFISDGAICELDVSDLWENLTDESEGVKTMSEEPVIATAVMPEDEEVPITEFVLDTDGYNDFLFWTERDTTYAEGVEENSEEASLPENQYAERQIYGAWRSCADGEEWSLEDEDGNTYTELLREWSGVIQITDEQGANYSDIDMAAIKDGSFRLVYLKGYSTQQTIEDQTIVAEDTQNRVLCTSDINLNYLGYSIELDEPEELPVGVSEEVTLTAHIRNKGFLSEKNGLAVELLASVDGGEAETVDIVDLSERADEFTSGKTGDVNLSWLMPEEFESVEFTARVIAEYDTGETEFDTATVIYERKPDINITVVDSHMIDRNIAEITVELENMGDATAENYTVGATVGDSIAESQTYTLMPGEETTITFWTAVPEEEFVSQTKEDTSVIETAEITLSADSTPCVTTVERTATVEEMAIFNSTQNLSLEDEEGNAISTSITVEKNQLVTLRPTADMLNGYDASDLTLILETEEGEILCEGDSFIASEAGKLKVYVIPRGLISEVSVYGSSTASSTLPALASAAIRTMEISVVLDEENHEHTLTHNEKIDATCKDTGVKEHWSCTCGKLFLDESGTTEVTMNDLVIAIDSSNHTGETEIRDAKNATEIEDGYTGDTYCKDCGAKISAGTVIPATGSEHKVVVDNGNGGKIELSDETPNTGDIVTVTVIPDEGKMVDKVIVTDEDGNQIDVTDNKDGTYSYVQPNEDVTIKVTYKNKSATIPNTGDNYNIWIWYALLFASGGALTCIAHRQRRKKVTK